MSKGSQGRLRVFFADFEGDDETIQEGLKALTVAVSKTFAPKVVTVNRLIAPGTASPASSVGQEEQVIGAEQAFAEEPADDAEWEPAKAKSESKRKPPTLTLVKELNLMPEGKSSYRDFHAQKSPATQFDQIAVAVYYLRMVLETSGVTPNHVFTCFKNVGVKVPPDLPQIIRNCAARKGWVDPAGPDGITIPTAGQNYVEHDLPPKAAK